MIGPEETPQQRLQKDVKPGVNQGFTSPTSKVGVTGFEPATSSSRSMTREAFPRSQ